MFTAIYVRVSHSDQNFDSQEIDLRIWAEKEKENGVEIKWFKDKATGTNFERPEWKKLEAAINMYQTDRVVVWRLDRLGRSASDTIKLLDILDEKKIYFLSLKDNIDSTTASGRLVRNMLASFAEYETQVRRERQRAGIEAAKLRGDAYKGRKKGSRWKATKAKMKAVKELNNYDMPIAEIARAVGLARETVYTIIREQENQL